jgi:glyoxylase-like metal-dependent hydrolase (beta-lactamase superfamily II)
MNSADADIIGDGFRKQEPFEPDVFFTDGETLSLCGLNLKVIFTPGHTRGGTCFLVGDTLFSGDTLFCGDVGRTDLAGGSFSAIRKSIQTRLYVLDDSVVVYPGHDESTTIGYEKLHNHDVTLKN